MNYKFSLHAGEIGTYEWGSLVTRFASLANVSARRIVEIMESANAKTANWTTGAEFRGYIAALHELVHYFQDAYTRIGQWDYIVRHNHKPKMLAHARFFSWDPQLNPPYLVKMLENRASNLISQYVNNYRNDLAEMLSEFIYAPFDDFSDRRSESILAFIRTLNPSLSVPSGVEEPFTLKSLLEGEAVAMVFLQLDDLGMSDEHWEIAEDHKYLYSPGELPEIYSQTIDEVFQIIQYKFGDGISVEFKVREGLVLTIFLVDLACAYPTPEHLTSLHTKKDYEPGIRFIRLLRAFQTLTEKETIRDFVLAINKSKFDDAEAYLLQECEFPYLRAIDIYKSWLALYENMEISGKDPVFEFRKKCIKQRVSNFSSYVFKKFTRMIESTHFYLLTSKGIQSMGSSAEYFNLEAQRSYTMEFLVQNRDWELLNFFLGSGKYVCPLAEARLCDAAIPACIAGIHRREEFPPKPGCFVRQGLENSGFSLSSN